MTTSFETAILLDSIEKMYNQTLMHRVEIGYLIDTANSQDMRSVLEDIIFYAKFITRAQEILKREGITSEQTEKLEVELRAAVENTTKWIKTVIEEAPDEVKMSFQSRFLGCSPECLSRFFALMHELAIVKNYILDKQRSA